MKRYSFYLMFLMVVGFNSAYAQEMQEAVNDMPPAFIINENEQIVTINNEHFRSFLVTVVEEALKNNNQAMLSDALLRCYECMISNENQYPFKELQEALPELLAFAVVYCQEQNEAKSLGQDGYSLKHDSVGHGTCDLSSVVILLNQLFKSLNTCCSILQSDFQQTWTILANLNVSATTVVDLSGIFTALADIDATLTACCENITREFQETWTILNNLTITVSGSPCNATPILASTFITSPGSYCLANDIIGAITITANNVTLDLNNHTISSPGSSAIIVSGAHNIIITNGKIDNSGIGVQLLTTETIELSNLLITNCLNTGIRFTGNNSGHFVHDVIIDSSQFEGIFGDVFLNNSIFQRVTINTTLVPFAISGSFNVIQDMEIVDCGTRLITGPAFSLASGSNNQVINCSIVNFQGTPGFSIATNRTVLKSCSIQNLFTIFNGINTVGILLANNNLLVQDCEVVSVRSTAVSGNGTRGFDITSSNITLENCLVETCTSVNPIALDAAYFSGVSITECNFINCNAYNSGYGFFIGSSTATSLIFQKCESAFHSINGFNINTSDALIGNCVSFRNGGVGFLLEASGTTPIYSCFASGNTVNYINALNVQNANTTVGVFARGNNFI